MDVRDERALATRPVAEGTERIGLMFREEGTEGDSGWRFLSGNESSLYFMEPDCMVQVRIADILKAEPDIRPLLRAPVDTSYRRNAEGAFELSGSGRTEARGREQIIKTLADRPARKDSAAFRIILLLAAAAVIYLIIRSVL